MTSIVSETLNVTASPTTEFPGATPNIPSGTIYSGPAETSRAADSVPILFWLYAHREWIYDGNHKFEFISSLVQSRDRVLELFNSLSDRPEPKPECSSVSIRQTPMYDILDVLWSVPQLVSCAVQILETLVKSISGTTNLPRGDINRSVELLQEVGSKIIEKEEGPTQISSQATMTDLSTSASTSCIMSVTATQKSVFCTVTAMVGQDHPLSGECSTIAYNTIEDCTIVPSLTSTIVSTASISQGVLPSEACSISNCGTSCGLVSRDVLYKRRKLRAIQPRVCKWAERSNYSPAQDFMAGEVAIAVDNKASVILDGGVTSSVVGFMDQPISLAVEGLYGCTAVIAVSRRGAWAAHIFEAPLFGPSAEVEYMKDDEGKPVIDPATDQPAKRMLYLNPANNSYQEQLPVAEQLELFKETVLGALRESDGTSQNHRMGLKDCRNSFIEPQYDWEGHMFDDESDTRICLLAPLERTPQNDRIPFWAETDVGLGSQFILGLSPSRQGRTIF
ncbi:hypothetical protein JX266_014200 [Neoarthrinium moseri]|nr:hypothetical protein JX266_014200 [Neoarthrinium moseri]